MFVWSSTLNTQLKIQFSKLFVIYFFIIFVSSFFNELLFNSKTEVTKVVKLKYKTTINLKK